MTLPSFIVQQLLAMHARAEATPYFHLHGYMNRWWILGAASALRNDGNPAWKDPDFVAPQPSEFYDWLTEQVCIRAHTTLRGDNDRHCHDHPGDSISIVLEGGYWEEKWSPSPIAVSPLIRRAVFDSIAQGWAVDERAAESCGLFWRGPGAVVFRRAEDFHRLHLPPGAHCKSIFVMFKRRNEWGFMTPEGKVPAAEYFARERRAAERMQVAA